MDGRGGGHAPPITSRTHALGYFALLPRHNRRPAAPPAEFSAWLQGRAFEALAGWVGVAPEQALPCDRLKVERDGLLLGLIQQLIAGA